MARWNSCNVLQVAPDANRLWQFDAKGGNFILGREQKVASGEKLPLRSVAKSWSSLWQPKLNVAWLPPEAVFLRAVELPKSDFEETFSMVELQLEKLSPIPVTQIVWTMHILPQSAAENLQTVIVVIAERGAVEEFLGKLEGQNFLADRLETPLLDQLAAANPTEDGAWIYPVPFAGQNAALAAWWMGGALRNLSFLILPATGNRAAELKDQLTHFIWAGELEGWLTARPKWHLVADPVNAAKWENLLRASLGEPVPVVPPLPPQELAAHTARRAAAANPRTNLLPTDFSARYHQTFVDRLWLRGLFAAGIVYAVCVAVYFCATTVLGYKTQQVEQQVSVISDNYTNVLQLKARYDILKERQDLKYAALDCWKIVAEQLPEGITLQRFSFENGQKVSLNGTVTPDQISAITDDFYDPIRKAQVNGQPMFDGGDQLAYHQYANSVSWSFSLLLKHAEEQTP